MASIIRYRRVRSLGRHDDPAGGSFEELKGADIPLGIEPDWTYHEFSREGWSPGEVIVLGTDGIWETRNPQG